MANLDDTIRSILSHAAAAITHAVRASIADEVRRVLGVAGAAPAKAGAAPRATRTTGGRAKGGRGVRSFSDADLDRLLSAVKENPGVPPSKVQKASGLGAKQFKAAAKWLKKAGKLKVVGKARGTSYQTA